MIAATAVGGGHLLDIKKRSDIDILFTFNRDIAFFDFLDLREYLEGRLQAKVDMVMESALKPAIFGTFY
jgi:predicted nucleotidyltransferase